MNLQVCCYCKSAMEPMGFSLSIMPWNFKFQRAVAAQEMPWNFKFQSFCHAAKGMSCRLFCIDIYNLLPAGPSMQISPADQPAVLQSSWYRRLCLKANQTFKKGANPNPNPNPELFKRVGSTSKPKNMSNQPPRKIFQLPYPKKIVSNFHF